MKFCKGALHVMPVDYCKFHENRYKKPNFNRRITLKFATILRTYSSILKKSVQTSVKMFSFVMTLLKTEVMYFI